MDFDGHWTVVSSPDFDAGYLHEEGTPYVRLKAEGDRVDGEYQIGLMSGGIDGRLEGADRLTFTFEGMDELEEVHGAGVAIVKGDHLTFTLMYHQGDDWTFECERR